MMSLCDKITVVVLHAFSSRKNTRNTTKEVFKMGRFTGTIAFIFLLILSTLGVAAYVMQEAFQEPITFAEFFKMITGN